MIGPFYQRTGGASIPFASGENRKTVMTGSANRTAPLWKIPQPIRGDPERIKFWTQVNTGLEVDELTAVRE